MAKIQSKQDLLDYCLRKLGVPFVEVNVSDEQLEDRLDDAMLLYTQFHYDATETVYLQHKITQADLDRKDENGTRYLIIDPKFNDRIIGVRKLFHLSSLLSSSYMWDVKYQLWLSQLWDFTNIQLQYYNQVRTHLREIEIMFNGEVPIRFQRHKNRIYLDTNWEATFFKLDEILILECTAIIDPDEFTDVYNDMWLKLYTTALIKKQWAENLGKFANIQLPGGITLNSERMYAEASNDITKLEADLYDKYSMPTSFIVG